MVERVSNVFGIATEGVEKCFRDNRKKLDTFLSSESATPLKLFFFYQPRQSAQPELFLSLSKYDRITG